MIQKKQKYFLFYKPYGVLCQFSPSGGKPTLADYGPFPNDVYPAGRLDTDSEGLLLLTNDGVFKHRLLEPRYAHRRTYLVQVERIPGESDLDRLRQGVVIEKKKTLPAEVRLLPSEPPLPPRAVPIRFRAHIPTAWLELTLREGRNRQVRKMTAAIGFPTLRLVRSAMGPFSFDGLAPGTSRELTPAEARLLLEE